MEGFSLAAVAITVGAVMILLVVLAWKPLRKSLRDNEVAKAVQTFQLQREQLEAKFFDLAVAQGKPRGLRWLECDWQSRVSFGRDVSTGLLTAFVAVNIRFEAVEGGDMEDVEAVATVRDAAALFHYNRGRWGSGGRALFNMNPEDALNRLEGQFEAVSVGAIS